MIIGLSVNFCVRPRCVRVVFLFFQRMCRPSVFCLNGLLSWCVPGRILAGVGGWGKVGQEEMV